MGNNKQFSPTKKKLDQARKDGDVPRSRELSAAVGLIAGFCCLFFGYQRIFILGEFFIGVFSVAEDFDSNNMLVYGLKALEVLVFLLGPWLLVVMLAVYGSTVAQVGFYFSLIGLKFRFSRLGLLQGLKRMLGIREDEQGSAIPTGIFKDVLKLLCYGGVVGVVSTFLLLNSVSDLVNPSFEDSLEFAGSLFIFMARLLLSVSASYFLVGLVDLVLQRRRFFGKHRMDAEEMKRELRESDGDPHTEEMRKSLHRELLSQAVLSGVRRAKLVIVGRS